MASKELIETVAGYEEYIKSHGVDEQAVNAYMLAADTALRVEDDRKYGLKLSGRCKELMEEYVHNQTGGSLWELEKYCFANKTYYEILGKYYAILLLEARNMVFDSYMQYLEKKREPKDRFYMPKRKQLIKFGLIDALQGMLEDKYDILCISMIPGAGKTTLEKFFNSAVIGWYPKEFTLFYSHSGDITRMYFDGVYDIVTNDDEYTWGEIFPDLTVTHTNAKMEQFDINPRGSRRYKPFPSLQTASVGSKNAGKVRASKFLLVDDMIGGIEEALNKNILQKLWEKYSVDARQRKILDRENKPCKEIMIATRWSTVDPIGRLMAEYAGNPRVKAIAVPDIDPETGKSNFDYEYGGFSVEFFEDQARLMDKISYRCLYKQEPIEREGLLYHEDELRRYLTMPEREPDAILAICDVKNKGTDYMFLPVVQQYGEEYYLVDCICDDDADFGRQEQRCSDILVDYNVQQCRFESNNGGDRFAENVARRVKERGGRCNITTKPTETNKETKILVNADWVKQHVIFPDQSLYQPQSDIGRMMDGLLTYAITGKNEHDDVPDGWAMFALMVTEQRGMSRVEAIQNPFRMYGGL